MDRKLLRGDIKNRGILAKGRAGQAGEPAWWPGGEEGSRNLTEFGKERVCCWWKGPL